jgi:hypothetical protein
LCSDLALKQYSNQRRCVKRYPSQRIELDSKFGYVGCLLFPSSMSAQFVTQLNMSPGTSYKETSDCSLQTNKSISPLFNLGTEISNQMTFAYMIITYNITSTDLLLLLLLLYYIPVQCLLLSLGNVSVCVNLPDTTQTWRCHHIYNCRLSNERIHITRTSPYHISLTDAAWFISCPHIN